MAASRVWLVTFGSRRGMEMAPFWHKPAEDESATPKVSGDATE